MLCFSKPQWTLYCCTEERFLLTLLSKRPCFLKQLFKQNFSGKHLPVVLIKIKDSVYRCNYNSNIYRSSQKCAFHFNASLKILCPRKCPLYFIAIFFKNVNKQRYILKKCIKFTFVSISQLLCHACTSQDIDAP